MSSISGSATVSAARPSSVASPRARRRAVALRQLPRRSTSARGGLPRRAPDRVERPCGGGRAAAGAGEELVVLGAAAVSGWRRSTRVAAGATIAAFASSSGVGGLCVPTAHAYASTSCTGDLAAQLREALPRGGPMRVVEAGRTGALRGPRLRALRWGGRRPSPSGRQVVGHPPDPASTWRVAEGHLDPGLHSADFSEHHADDMVRDADDLPRDARPTGGCDPTSAPRSASPRSSTPCAT